jgi:hypothetical protein
MTEFPRSFVIKYLSVPKHLPVVSICTVHGYFIKDRRRFCKQFLLCNYKRCVQPLMSGPTIYFLWLSNAKCFRQMFSGNFLRFGERRLGNNISTTVIFRSLRLYMAYKVARRGLGDECILSSVITV